MLENNDQHDFIYTGRDIPDGDEEIQSTDVDMDTEKETNSEDEATNSEDGEEEEISKDEAIAWRFIMQHADLKGMGKPSSFQGYWENLANYRKVTSKMEKSIEKIREILNDIAQSSEKMPALTATIPNTGAKLSKIRKNTKI